MGQPRLIIDSDAPCADRAINVSPLDAVAEEAMPRQRQIAPRQDPVVIIDDDPAVRHSLITLLETYGFQIVAYASGIEFLADNRHDPFGCLIIDQHMPAMDGLDVLTVLRHEAIVVPTILITGRLDAATAARANELGVVSLLEKPFCVTRLLELIRNASDT
jgi:FixJ family two-component response regulator